MNLKLRKRIGRRAVSELPVPKPRVQGPAFILEFRHRYFDPRTFIFSNNATLHPPKASSSKNQMQKPVCLFAVLLLISCENSRYSNLESISFETTEIECVDKVAAGGIQTQRIDTREEFDSLVYFKYTVPLEEWLDNNYDFLTDGVILNYPDATPDEYDSIILNEYVYNFAPFSWTKDCTLPEIDFDKYTLLGKGICAGGCSMPGIENQVYLEDNALIFNTNITTYGSCEMLICINAWILVDKLDKDCEVIFKTETVNQEYSVN